MQRGRPEWSLRTASDPPVRPRRKGAVAIMADARSLVTTPRRIQCRRVKGWRMPEGAVYVGRPSKWGNPMTVSAYRRIEQELGFAPAPAAKVRRELTTAFRSLVTLGPDSGFWSPDNFKAVLTICDGLDKGEIRGKDLACWCPLDQPCHADVLLELANSDQDVTPERGC